MIADEEVELVYFEGCPHVNEARSHLVAALESVGRDAKWREWDLARGSVPERVRGYGSPTILVRGANVTGVAPGSAALACAVAGPPAIEVIRAALAGAKR